MPEPTASKISGFSLKDQLFNRQRVMYLAERFETTDSTFNAKQFVAEVMKDFSALELKQRIARIAQTLEKYLDPNFPTACDQIIAALPAPLDPTRSDDDFGEFIFAPLGEYVARNGLNAKHLKVSLKTLKALTMRFSMEDAMRPFINAYPEQTLAELRQWTTDKHYHVRRLVSECTRPLLPWSRRLTLPADTGAAFLDLLHADPTRYVTRSVANHLNDIAKTNPTLVLNTLTRWKAMNRQSEKEMGWITRHALRTLVKQGHPQALGLRGFHVAPDIKVSSFAVADTNIKPGDTLTFSFVVQAKHDVALLLDYVIDFVKSNRGRAPKVFKIKSVKMRAGQKLQIIKRHRLRADATTFSLYPGVHQLTLQINGKPFGSREFDVMDV